MFITDNSSKLVAIRHRAFFSYAFFAFSPIYIQPNLCSTTKLPFSTALDSEYNAHNFISPFLVYTLNVTFSGSMIALLWRYNNNPKHKLSEGLENMLFVRYQQKRALTVPAAFIVTFLIGLVLPFHNMSRIFLPTIPFIMVYLKRQFVRKLKAQEKKAAAELEAVAEE